MNLRVDFKALTAIPLMESLCNFRPLLVNYKQYLKYYVEYLLSLSSVYIYRIDCQFFE